MTDREKIGGMASYIVIAMVVVKMAGPNASTRGITDDDLEQAMMLAERFIEAEKKHWEEKR